MNFSIGLTGLKIAQQAIELVGTNLANSATEGYHRQELQLAPLDLASTASKVSMGGVEIVGVSRGYDVLLERENLRQQPIYGQLTQELQALNSIESVLAQVDNNAINLSINNFFSTLNQLAGDPDSLAYAQGVLWSGDTMAANLRDAYKFLEDMQDQVFRQAKQLVGEMNNQVDSIARLNNEIDLSMRSGNSANLLKDQRDQAILEIAQLGDVFIDGMFNEDGNANVQAWGIPMVVGDQSMHIEVGLNGYGNMGIGVAGTANYDSSARGGELGGLVELYNEIIPDLMGRLDRLAQEMMYGMNQFHVQGVGKSGSFTELTGLGVPSEKPLGEWSWPAIQDGSMYLRLTNSAGNTSMHEVTISTGDTLQTVINKLNGLNGREGIPMLNGGVGTDNTIVASQVNSALRIQTNNGYKIDFVPDYITNITPAETRETAIFTGGVNNVPLIADGTTNLMHNSSAGAETLDIDFGEETITINFAAGQTMTVNDFVTAYNAAATNSTATLNQGNIILRNNADGENTTVWNIANAGNNIVWGDGTGPVQPPVTTADADYTDADPTILAGSGGGADVPAINISGLYEGENQDYTFSIINPAGGAAEVGITADLKLQVTNDATGEVIQELNIGQGYAAGDRLEIEKGIVITLGPGVLNDGESFNVKAMSDTDDTNFLVAAGMNTFFQGSGASDISIRSEFYTDAHRLASSLGPDGLDSSNVQRMAKLGNESIAALGSTTFSEYHLDWVSDIGQQTMIRESRLDAAKSVKQQLENQRAEISGVDPNEEAAKLIMYERMFQSMSKVISTQNNALQTLMDIL